MILFSQISSYETTSAALRRRDELSRTCFVPLFPVAVLLAFYTKKNNFKRMNFLPPANNPGIFLVNSYLLSPLKKKGNPRENIIDQGENEKGKEKR